uniref:Ribosomal protein S6 n=1 Tax=Cyanophora sudae TaxID=1522369 RepID=A0A2Z4HFZ9_9EUKA|nr:ribosomal protein S6 [Cyanophora sudae]AWW13706.1 ribosomal protein S6 [Cyanophora sudae]
MQIITLQKPSKQITYRTTYILKPNLTEEEITKEVEDYQKLLLDNAAEDIIIENTGKCRLAYFINKQSDGIYFQITYRGTNNLVNLLQRKMRLSTNMLRYQTFKI